MPQVEVIQQFSESNNSILTIPITTMTDTKDNVTIAPSLKEDDSAVVQKFQLLVSQKVFQASTIFPSRSGKVPGSPAVLSV
jgi:hypothetical protein